MNRIKLVTSGNEESIGGGFSAQGMWDYIVWANVVYAFRIQVFLAGACSAVKISWHTAAHGPSAVTGGWGGRGWDGLGFSITVDTVGLPASFPRVHSVFSLRFWHALRQESSNWSPQTLSEGSRECREFQRNHFPASLKSRTCPVCQHHLYSISYNKGKSLLCTEPYFG